MFEHSLSVSKRNFGQLELQWHSHSGSADVAWQKRTGPWAAKDDVSEGSPAVPTDDWPLNPEIGPARQTLAPGLRHWKVGPTRWMWMALVHSNVDPTWMWHWSILMDPFQREPNASCTIDVDCCWIWLRLQSCLRSDTVATPWIFQGIGDPGILCGFQLAARESSHPAMKKILSIASDIGFYMFLGLIG